MRAAARHELCGTWKSLHTTEEVLVDLLAVGLGDKPVELMSAQIPSEISVMGVKLTLSRVPGVLRGIALTTQGFRGEVVGGRIRDRKVQTSRDASTECGK